jgi:predicted O-methyltransferase YrrM
VSKQHQIISYVKYLLQAKGPHGTHSPFIFSFINEVLKDKRQFYAFEEIENLRSELLQNNTTIEIEDFGAGSLHNKNNTRRISEIAKNAGRSKKHGELLFRIANYFELNNVLELGTSLGLGTSYLAKAREKSQIITIEGCPAIREQAVKNFEQIGLTNINAYLGNFDDILQNVLSSHPKFDLIFIDGNHRKIPTLKYFEILKQSIHQNSLIIFDDIHWSAEMTEAWNKIKKDHKVKVSIDLFQFGLVFFMKEVKEKQDFILRY